MGTFAAPILGRLKRIRYGQRLTFLESCALQAWLLFSFTDKRAKRDKHNAGQMAKKGLDAGSDVSSEGDGYLDSQEEDYRSDTFASLDGEIF